MSKTSFLTTVFLGGVASIVTALPGSAATITGATFYLAGPYDMKPSFSYQASGIGLTTSANNAYVSRTWAGLGVKRNFFDSPQVDGRGKDDVLRLDFDKEVALESALFTWVGRGDGAKVTVDGEQLFKGNLPGRIASFVSFNDNKNTGFSFKFGVTDNTDDYFLKKVKITHFADGETIPEPITILGTLTAVGVGTVIKRRHTKLSG